MKQVGIFARQALEFEMFIKAARQLGLGNPVEFTEIGSPYVMTVSPHTLPQGNYFTYLALKGSGSVIISADTLKMLQDKTREIATVVNKHLNTEGSTTARLHGA
jgi:hypothetical protein